MTYNGLEHRKLDPERQLPTEFHGPRALGRFIGKKPGEDFDETTDGNFTEGAEMKNVLAGFLENREVRGPIDLARLAEKQYEEAKQLTPLQEGDKGYPSIEAVKQVLARFTPVQLEAINEMQDPKLQLEPVTSGERSLADLNTNKPMRGQRDAYVSEWIEGMLGKADEHDKVSGNTIVDWRVGVQENTNAPEVLDGDDITKPLGERCAWFEKVYGPKGVTGVTIKGFAKLQQAGLAKNPPRPVDDVFGEGGTVTILNGEPIDKENGLVACGYWSVNDPRVHLDGLPTAFRNNNARFRVSVMGDVLDS